MWGVQAFSRLHFGLLNVPNRSLEPSRQALGVRWFGGAGLMVERPGLRVQATPSSAWSASGPLAERALAFAQRFTHGLIQRAPEYASLPPRQLLLEWAAPEHVGLGTGTQLGLSVARVLSASWKMEWGTRELAGLVGRGLRSSLGMHGFEQGGFLVDAGKRRPEDLAPLVARLVVPEDWRVVLVLPGPDETVGLHGASEVEAFAQLTEEGVARARTEGLCRLVLMGLLPALVEGDLDAFGEALFEFNVRVGEVFAPVQGAVYAGARVAELVAFVRGEGVRGVGQSSWGPTVFALVADEGQAVHLATRLQNQFALDPSTVLVTRACNRGALLT
jgi:beta-ribofuranosylaminobenzene 5'-phosphate synthase